MVVTERAAMAVVMEVAMKKVVMEAVDMVEDIATTKFPYSLFCDIYVYV